MLQQETEEKSYEMFLTFEPSFGLLDLVQNVHTDQIFKISKKILPSPHIRPSAPTKF